MSSEVKANKLSPATGTDVTLGDASDTFTLPASATLDVNGTLDLAGSTMTGFTIPSGQTVTVASSGEIDIASGATLDVNGTIDVTGATVTGLSAGKVLQVVSSMYKGAASTTSNSLVTTGLEGTITPSATSSKILISISFSMAASGGDAAPWIQLYKGSSVLSGSLGDVQGSRLQASVDLPYNATQSTAFNYLDSPSTTSATTYKLMYAVSPGRPAGNTLYMNMVQQPNTAYHHTAPATMILMEIEG